MGAGHYDAYGNRLTQDSQTLPYNSDNRISSGNGVTYDALGNIRTEVVASVTNTYTYDAENRLTKIEASGATVVDYLYDAFGRRTKKNLATGTDREYFYDLGGRMVVETNDTGGVWGVEYYAGGLHVGTYTSGHTYFSHQDYIGTERVKTDENGVIAQDCTYGPFGDNESCTGGINSMIKYAGYERDSESGLDHMWFRYYNPRLGRFMTTDPYGGSMDISDPQSMNRYAYVNGNPTNYFDPLGLEWVCSSTSINGVPNGPGTCRWVSDFHPPGEVGQKGVSDAFGRGFSFDGMAMVLDGLEGVEATAEILGHIVDAAASTICSALPDGRVTSVNNSWGGVGSVGGSFDVVVNYRSGEVTGFATATGQAGWNGGVSIGLSTGLVYGLGNSNAKYSGSSRGFGGSGPTPIPFVGVGGALSRGNGVTVSSVNVGASPGGKIGGGISHSETSNGKALGKRWAFSPGDWAVHSVKRMCR